MTGFGWRNPIFYWLPCIARSKNRRNFAYCYVERALSTFRDCNGLAFAAGYDCETSMDCVEDGVVCVCREDMGHFWEQIVEVYILGGHILLANAQYADAKDMYSLAHALAVRSKNNTNTTSISEALENLAVVSMYSNCVHDSIRYTQEIIAHLGAMKPPAPHIKILNARAYYACCLTLPASPQEKSAGYFGLHFVHCKDWQRAHKHIEYVMACVQKREFELFEKNVICDLLRDYCEAVLDTSTFMANEWLQRNIMRIHDTHCLFVNQINKNNADQINVLSMIMLHLRILCDAKRLMATATHSMQK
eukprot:478575_1